MSDPNEGPDPEKTRETRTPPPIPPTHQVPSSPADGPTRFIPATPPLSPPPRRNAPPPPIPRYRPPAGPPPRPAPATPPTPRKADRPLDGPATELPWWQTINRDRPPKPPTPPASPPAPPRRPAQPAPPAAAVSGSARTATWWWVTAAAGAAVVIAGTALGLALTGTPAAPKVLDISKANREVEQILRDPIDGYAAATVAGVVCNNGVNPPITRGGSFSCDAVVDGAPRHVAVIFQDDAGTYAVDRPR